jgi:phage terminase large subunit-like protein
MQARENPLHLTITTAGLNKNVPCFALHQTCREILRGIKTDPAQFCIMYELDPHDEKNWTDPALWIKANPSMGETITESALQKQCVQAVNFGGSRETEFKTKHLNVWTTSAKTWIPDKFWEQCGTNLEPSGPCFGGMDLASVSDLTTLVLIWPKAEKIVVRGWYWLPRDTYETNLAANPGHIFREFAQLPNFILTDGNATNYDAIRKLISGTYIANGRVEHDDDNLMQRHNIEKIAFDRYNSTQIAINLVDDGVPIAPFGQGFVSMSPGAKQLEILLRSGELSHDNDPVLRWCLQNVTLKTDPAGNIKPDKSKSSAKIDPIVALCMAIGEHLRAEPQLDPDSFKIISL